MGMEREEEKRNPPSLRYRLRMESIPASCSTYENGFKREKGRKERKPIRGKGKTYPKKAIPIDEREGEMAVRARDCTGEGADFRGQMGFEIGIRTH